MSDKPKFNPNLPATPVKPRFDPSQPHTPVEAGMGERILAGAKGALEAIPDPLKKLIAMHVASQGGLAKGATLGYLPMPEYVEKAQGDYPMVSKANEVAGSLLPSMVAGAGAAKLLPYAAKIPGIGGLIGKVSGWAGGAAPETAPGAGFGANVSEYVSNMGRLATKAGTQGALVGGLMNPQTGDNQSYLQPEQRIKNALQTGVASSVLAPGLASLLGVGGAGLKYAQNKIGTKLGGLNAKSLKGYAENPAEIEALAKQSELDPSGVRQTAIEKAKAAGETLGLKTELNQGALRRGTTEALGGGTIPIKPGRYADASPEVQAELQRIASLQPQRPVTQQVQMERAPVDTRVFDPSTGKMMEGSATPGQAPLEVSPEPSRVSLEALKTKMSGGGASERAITGKPSLFPVPESQNVIAEPGAYGSTGQLPASQGMPETLHLTAEQAQNLKQLAAETARKAGSTVPGQADVVHPGNELLRGHLQGAIEGVNPEAATINAAQAADIAAKNQLAYKGAYGPEPLLKDQGLNTRALFQQAGPEGEALQDFGNKFQIAEQIRKAGEAGSPAARNAVISLQEIMNMIKNSGGTISRQAVQPVAQALTNAGVGDTAQQGLFGK